MGRFSIPRLLQARLIESFENYDIAHAPLRAADVGQTDFQLLIDVRRFRVATEAAPVAEIGLSARILDKDGKIVASRLFEETEKFEGLDPPAVHAASDSYHGGAGPAGGSPLWPEWNKIIGGYFKFHWTGRRRSP